MTVFLWLLQPLIPYLYYLYYFHPLFPSFVVHPPLFLDKSFILLHNLTQLLFSLLIIFFFYWLIIFFYKLNYSGFPQLVLNITQFNAKTLTVRMISCCSPTVSHEQNVFPNAEYLQKQWLIFSTLGCIAYCSLCLSLTTHQHSAHCLFPSVLLCTLVPSFLPSLPSSVSPVIFSAVLFLKDRSDLINFVFIFWCLCVNPSLQRTTLSPTKYCHCLIITLKTSQTDNVAPLLHRVMFYFVNMLKSRWRATWHELLHQITPPSLRLLEWLTPPSWTTESCYVSFILKERVRPTSLCIRIPSSRPCDSPQSRETGNGAERRDSPARD